VKFGVNDEADKKKRIDIGFFGDYNDLAAIIECKAYSIKDKEAPYAQAGSYVRSLKIPAYFVTDGVLLEGYNYYYETDQFVKMDRIPMYEELCV
nr:type I restriction enzyme HsdR N-terminal domain-containing protein [Lachnospiraceae bacterium]